MYASGSSVGNDDGGDTSGAVHVATLRDHIQCQNNRMDSDQVNTYRRLTYMTGSIDLGGSPSASVAALCVDLREVKQKTKNKKTKNKKTKPKNAHTSQNKNLQPKVPRKQGSVEQEGAMICVRRFGS